MLPHGIGLCYGCENDFLAIMITSFDSSDRDKLLPGPPGSRLPRVTAPEFQRALFQAFEDIYGLVERHYKPTNPTCKM